MGMIDAMCRIFTAFYAAYYFIKSFQIVILKTGKEET